MSDTDAYKTLLHDLLQISSTIDIYHPQYNYMLPIRKEDFTKLSLGHCIMMTVDTSPDMKLADIRVLSTADTVGFSLRWQDDAISSSADMKRVDFDKHTIFFCNNINISASRFVSEALLAVCTGVAGINAWTCCKFRRVTCSQDTGCEKCGGGTLLGLPKCGETTQGLYISFSSDVQYSAILTDTVNSAVNSAVD